MQFNIFNRRPKETTETLFDEKFLRRLERLNFRTAPRLRGVMLGEQRSRNLRPALDFSDHRAYVSGDDLRHIDWHIYAHHEELFIKLGESSQSVNVHILLDCSRSMAWQSNASVFNSETDTDTPANLKRNRSKWNVARRLAGALAYLALSSGERVTITTFADDLGASFGPSHGKRQMIAPLRFLTALNPAPAMSENDLNREPGLARSLTNYARRHSEGGLFILISDLLDTVPSSLEPATEKNGPLADGLRHLNPPRWQVLVMHLLTTAEMQPGLEGDFDFEDIETGQDLPFSVDKDTLAQYRLRVRRWCAAAESACARQGTTYSRILAEWPLEQKVIPYLRQRGVVR